MCQESHSLVDHEVTAELLEPSIGQSLSCSCEFHPSVKAHICIGAVNVCLTLNMFITEYTDQHGLLQLAK